MTLATGTLPVINRSMGPMATSGIMAIDACEAPRRCRLMASPILLLVERLGIQGSERTGDTGQNRESDQR